MHHAVRHRELGGRHVQHLGRPSSISSRRASAAVGAQCMPPARHAVAPPSRRPYSTVSAVSPMTMRTRVQRHVDLFGHHLRNGGFQPLPAVDLAVIARSPCRPDRWRSRNRACRASSGGLAALGGCCRQLGRRAASATTSAPAPERKARRLRVVMRRDHGHRLTDALRGALDRPERRVVGAAAADQVGEASP